LVAEAGRRGLAEAVPVLDAYCRRFAGFGVNHLVPEQVAALRGLAAIGGRDAAAAVTRLIVKAAVQGPTLKVAVSVAAHLGSDLPADIVLLLLSHSDPQVRSNACRCGRPTPSVVSALINLLDDLDEEVRVTAACALGRMGNRDARPLLTRRLRDDPSPEVIDAISRIADEDCIILLGRLLRTESTLADVVLDALDASDHPRAAQIIGNMQG
jgi:plasmid stability protein